MRVAMPARPNGPKVAMPGQSAVTSSARRAKVGIGAADVGDVDREEAAAADVAEPHREREADRDGQHERGAGEEELLDR